MPCTKRKDTQAERAGVIMSLITEREKFVMDISLFMLKNAFNSSVIKIIAT